MFQASLPAYIPSIKDPLKPIASLILVMRAKIRIVDKIWFTGLVRKRVHGQHSLPFQNEYRRLRLSQARQSFVKKWEEKTTWFKTILLLASSSIGTWENNFSWKANKKQIAAIGSREVVFEKLIHHFNFLVSTKNS